MTESGIRRLLRSGGINFVGMALRLGLSFAVTLFAARYLGKTDYGAVSVGTTILTAGSTLLMLGVGQGVGSFLPRYDAADKRRSVLVSSFTIVIPLSLAACLGLVVFAEPLAVRVFNDGSLTPIIRICALGIPAANLAQLAVSAIRGKQQTLPKVIIDDVVLLGSRALLIAVFIAVGAGTLAIASVYPLSFAISSVLGLYYLVRKTTLVSGEPVSTMHGKLLSFSLPLWISAGMSIVYSGFDTFILAYFSNTGDVGIYKAVYPVAFHLTIVLMSISYIVLPTFSELHSDGSVEKMNSFYESVSLWIFLGSLPVFVVFFSFPGDVLGLLFGSEYVPGRTALKVLVLGFFFHSVIGPNAEILKAVDEPRLVMIDDALSAALNLGLNLVLVPRYSYLGAAVATTISYVFLNVAYSYHLYQRRGIHPFSTYYVVLFVLTSLFVLFVESSSLLARLASLI